MHANHVPGLLLLMRLPHAWNDSTQVYEFLSFAFMKRSGILMYLIVGMPLLGYHAES
jgi:hypothetical protein